MAGFIQCGGDVPEPSAGESVVDIADQVLTSGVVEGIVAVDNHRTFDHFIAVTGHRVRLIQKIIGILGIGVGVDDRPHHIQGDVVGKDAHRAELVFRNQLEQGRIAIGELGSSSGNIHQAQEIGGNRTAGYLDIHGVTAEHERAAVVGHLHVEPDRRKHRVDIIQQVLQRAVAQRVLRRDGDRNHYFLVGKSDVQGDIAGKFVTARSVCWFKRRGVSVRRFAFHDDHGKTQLDHAVLVDIGQSQKVGVDRTGLNLEVPRRLEADHVAVCDHLQPAQETVGLLQLAIHVGNQVVHAAVDVKERCRKRRFHVRTLGDGGQAQKIGIDRSASDRETVNAGKDQIIVVKEYLNIGETGVPQDQGHVVSEVLQVVVGHIDGDGNRCVISVPVAVDRHVERHLYEKIFRGRYLFSRDDMIEIIEIGAGSVGILHLDSHQGGNGVIVAVGGDHLQCDFLGKHAGRGKRPAGGKLVHVVVSPRRIHIKSRGDAVQSEILG